MSQLIAALFGVAPKVAAIALAVIPEVREAVQHLEGVSDLSGPEKAALIAREAGDVLDALDDHLPGWSDKLDELHRDEVIERMESSVVAIAELVYQLRRITDILVAEGVIRGGLVARIRARRR